MATQGSPASPFCVTLVGFTGSQAGDFEESFRQTDHAMRIDIRHKKHVSDASYPAAVVHAVVLTPEAIAGLSKIDADAILSATTVGTCRVYLLGAAPAQASPEWRRVEELINRMQAQGSLAVAGEIISFFKNADRLNRHSTLLHFRDRTCIYAFVSLKYLWPVSYAFAVIHIINAISDIAVNKAWLGQHIGGYAVLIATFFGIFFVVHCMTTITRNGMLALRIAKTLPAAFALGAAGFGMAAAVTAYSVVITDSSISHIIACVIIAVAAQTFFLYCRRIFGECTSLSQLQTAIADPKRRENELASIGKYRIGRDAFPLFSFRGRSLFISYMHGSPWSSETAALVRQWAARQGWEVFLDRSSIPPGSLWRQHLLRAVSECGFFVAVIDGDADMTDWVLAESAYAARLRKDIGKPRILLIVRNAQRIAADKQNPVHLIYLDVFRHSAATSLGAAILPVSHNDPLTEERFRKAVQGVKPLCLIS